MIQLSNGHTFSVAAASGALGFDGDDSGHGIAKIWKTPWRWLGYIDTKRVVVIVKTLTLGPRKGRLRWWCPWKAIWPIKGGSWCNSVSLTNPGIHAWIDNTYPHMMRKGYKFIVSVQPEDVDEAKIMGRLLRKIDSKFTVGIEMNLCPNVQHIVDFEQVSDCILALRDNAMLPVGLKVGPADDYIGLAKYLEYRIEWIDAVNAAPWKMVMGDIPSPLAKYGVIGSVSGEDLRSHARRAMQLLVKENMKTPILAGGGINSATEARWRLRHGADAISIGTAYLRPWQVPEIIQVVNDYKMGF